MAEHPPEESIRQADEAARKADPHGVGQQGQAQERAKHEPAAQTTGDRHKTETALQPDAKP